MMLGEEYIVELFDAIAVKIVQLYRKQKQKIENKCKKDSRK